jgi:glycosyltransferase involved in cell wall biosynthesis
LSFVNMKLIIAGLIQDEKYYEENVKPYLDNNSVVYAGCADQDSRNTLMGNAYALIHLINFNEPFGLSVVEAMACGTPVIAINRGSMPELITNETNGFLVTNRDESIEAVKKIKQIDRQNCRSTVEERFSSDRMVTEYIQAYNKVIEKELFGS